MKPSGPMTYTVQKGADMLPGRSLLVHALLFVGAALAGFSLAIGLVGCGSIGGPNDPSWHYQDHSFYENHP